MASLQGQVALITGAGDGMGRADVLLMAQGGDDIVVSDIRGDAAEETAKQVRALGRRAHVGVVDMADVAEVQSMAASAAQALGPVDILVNNAGYGQRALIDEISEEDFDRMFAVHVR